MTEYQAINAARTAENIRKIVAATQTPATFKDIQAATGLHHMNIRTLIVCNMEYFKYAGKTEARGADRRRVMYEARPDVELHKSQAPTLGAVIHRLQDSPKYHDNMRLLRDNRKLLKVWVSGSTLA